jgi:hypothetical protein
VVAKRIRDDRHRTELGELGIRLAGAHTVAIVRAAWMTPEVVRAAIRLTSRAGSGSPPQSCTPRTSPFRSPKPCMATVVRPGNVGS